jgi:hypothetical protein
MADNPLQVPAQPRALASFVAKQVMPRLRRLDEAMRARTAVNEDAFERGGDLWSLLDRIAWADPDLVRSHVMPLEVAVQGVALADGVPVQSPGDVVAGSYFIIRRLTGFVEIDPTDPLESVSSQYITVQLEDAERQNPVFRSSFRMKSLVGTLFEPGTPMEFDEAPVAFLPRARVIATFTPLNGFPSAASALTNLTTRTAALRLDGVLVKESLVDALKSQNRMKLVNRGILPKGG